MNHTDLRLRRIGLRGRLWLLGLAVLIFLTACGSNALTRSRAAEVIKSSDEFQKPVVITVQSEYRQTLTLIGAGSQTTPKEEFALGRFLESHADLAVLNHLRLVDFKVDKIEYPNSASSPVMVAATLTDEGRSTSGKWPRSGEGSDHPHSKAGVGRSDWVDGWGRRGEDRKRRVHLALAAY